MSELVEAARAEMRAAMAEYLKAKREYRRVHAEYRNGGRHADPEYMAKKDSRVRTAMGDEAFYGAEVTACALFILAEQSAPPLAVAPSVFRPGPDRVTRTDAAATPAVRRQSYDPTPTVVNPHLPGAYVPYARRLDLECPGWWRDDPEVMAPGLAEQARLRRIGVVRPEGGEQR